MKINRIVIVLLYLCILSFLALPSLKIGLIEVGAINIYIFEIPLVISFLIAVLLFIKNNKLFNKQDYAVVRIYAYSFIPLILIGIVGAINSEARIATILSSTRPILYWLSGPIVVLSGHNNLKSKTLFWVITAGVLLQFIFGVIYLHYGGEASLVDSDRFTGRSGFLLLIIISALFVNTTKSADMNYIFTYKEYMVIVSSVIVISVFVMLMQNRTTWIVIALEVGYIVIKERKLVIISKILMLCMLVVLSFILLYKTGLIQREMAGNIDKRFYEETISLDGAVSTMFVRSYIYGSAYNDFLERPILGHGFGHIMSFVNFSDPKNITEQSGMDNSFINITHKFGIVGLIIFLSFLFKILYSLKHKLQRVMTEDAFYIKAFYIAFPFICLASLNIDILYNYPEVIIISTFTSKGFCLKRAY